MKKPLLTTLSLCLAMVSGFAQENFSIDSLMAKMTLEEKIGQMNQLVSGVLTGTIENTVIDVKIRSGQVGSILNERGKTAAALQKIAVEQTRLGIPLVFGLDVIHGYETCFPIPLAMASSWNLETITEACQVAGQEASRDGIAWTFTPM